MSLPPELIARHAEQDARRALDEDVGSGDLTAALIAEETRLLARVVAREAAVLCGRPWFDAVFRLVDPSATVDWMVDEGERVAPGQALCRIGGAARSLLTAERAALNFLQLLSGVATRTREYVDAIAGAPARILDTRKTLPGLRFAQKYAVVTGGGANHRMGLYDMVLIKENHIAAAGGITAAIRAAAHVAPGKPLQVEVETEAQLAEALEAGATHHPGHGTRDCRDRRRPYLRGHPHQGRARTRPVDAFRSLAPGHRRTRPARRLPASLPIHSLHHRHRHHA